MGRKCIESIMPWGASKVGKTFQGGQLAEWVNKKWGKKARLYGTSGGEWATIQGAVIAGIVEPTFLPIRARALETMDRASKGWWPEHPDDPDSPMLPPESQRDFADVGAWIFDGISEACDWAMNYSLESEARGGMRIGTEKAAMPYADGEFKFASASGSHYGSVQNMAVKWVSQSKVIGPGIVMWTALEVGAQDESEGVRKGQLLYGPDVIGKKQTSKAPSWFGNTVHLTAEQGKGGALVRRMYTEVHFDNFGTPFVAGTRQSWKFPIPKILEGDDCSVAKLLDLLEESHRKEAESIKQRIQIGETNK